MGKDTKRLVRGKLREAAEPIRREASARFLKYHPRSAAKYGISVRKVGTVSVEQRLRKSADVGRRRSNFGGLQMRKALIPALGSNADQVERKVEEAVSLACRKFNLK